MFCISLLLETTIWGGSEAGETDTQELCGYMDVPPYFWLELEGSGRGGGGNTHTGAVATQYFRPLTIRIITPQLHLETEEQFDIFQNLCPPSTDIIFA